MSVTYYMSGVHSAAFNAAPQQPRQNSQEDTGWLSDAKIVSLEGHPQEDERSTL